MSWRTYDWDDLADDEPDAISAGLGCGLCLDFGSLPDLGPCPRCRVDEHTEHLIATAQVQLDATWAEEHDVWEVVA